MPCKRDASPAMITYVLDVLSILLVICRALGMKKHVAPWTGSQRAVQTRVEHCSPLLLSTAGGRFPR